MCDEKKNPEICCPEFDPAPWDGKTHVWQEKLFIRESMRTFLHMPWPPFIGKLMTRLGKTAKDAGAATPDSEYLCLCEDPTPWRSEWNLSVTKEVPGADNVKMSGTFMTKVFDGPYNAVPKWIKEMNEWLAKEGRKPVNYYVHYTSCPKCAKKYGHNYVIVFAKVEG